MATSAIAKELYPFATEDHQAIPLDIIRPLSIKRVTFLAAGVAASIVVPITWKVAAFYSDAGCFIQFAAATIPNPPVSGTEYADVLWVPPHTLVTSTVLDGTARVISADGVTAGFLIAQQIQKWAGLALNRQVTKM